MPASCGSHAVKVECPPRRVVLAGDATHCPSPFSGQGTSLGLVGEFVPVQEILRNRDDIGNDFAAYVSPMRPYLLLNQELVDLNRGPPVPDERMTRAKNGIGLSDLLNCTLPAQFDLFTHKASTLCVFSDFLSLEIGRPRDSAALT
jgi:2-polyprenyl-6-methoxyphenol hydroxylase-like FAD-dependent oxidoreductase